MSPVSYTSVDGLRAVIVDAIDCSAQELYEFIGQLVLATTSGGYSDAPPRALSVHYPDACTTVLLADRIPVGREAQALAAEIVRWHGHSMARRIFGDRLDELYVDEHVGEVVPEAINETGFDVVSKVLLDATLPKFTPYPEMTPEMKSEFDARHGISISDRERIEKRLGKTSGSVNAEASLNDGPAP